MLSNFKKRFHSSPRPEQQPFLADTDTPNTECPNNVVAQQQWDTAMTETVYVAGCTCPLCVMRSDVADPASRNHACRSLPSFRSVMEVLYPPSYLGTPSPLPGPPSYSLNDSIREDDTEVSPLISSAPASQSHSPPQDPSLTGVPSQGTPLNIEPSPPCLDNDIPEEPLPSYTRFDQRRPRFPNASDILGPYPPMSVICRSVR
ncbi:hypothetical protein L210DRAFT_3537395 [Boletus edulis BED1]|uniref:Uncharacterized protein n=1 Tax=Boletus edulis BED1 TaxID=1328754 RepID=A0AAD4BW18_BOLED|nr:hypothetical protein L210DRAFT_3537395 [Boletus edulis BED1]